MRARLLGRGLRLLRPVAHGGQGAIYAAEHVRIGLPVVVKILTERAGHDPALRRQLTQEAEMLASLHHPHVVAIIDFDFVFEEPYIVMERLQGETLRRRLAREDALSLDEAVRLSGQIASALRAAHDAGIVHCDVKPSNVFLQRAAGVADFVKVIDFGVAERLIEPRSSRRRAGPVGRMMHAGTPRYMAPEQACGEGRVDERTDQFALAVVTWEMITGTSPFAGHTIPEALDRIIRGDIPHLDAEYPGVFPEELDEVLARAMARRRRDRYPDVLSFASALKAATRHRGRRPTVPPRSMRRPRQRGEEPSATTMDLGEATASEMESSWLNARLDGRSA